MSLDTNGWPIVQTRDGFFRFVNHAQRYLTAGFDNRAGLENWRHDMRGDATARARMAARYADEYGPDLHTAGPWHARKGRANVTVYAGAHAVAVGCSDRDGLAIAALPALLRCLRNASASLADIRAEPGRVPAAELIAECEAAIALATDLDGLQS